LARDSHPLPELSFTLAFKISIMKKLFFVLLSFSFISAGAQTVDEIIQKYTANLGGLDAFNNIKTAKITGTLSSMGNDMSMTIQIMNNKASRADFDFTGKRIINVYNNGKGWKQNPFAGFSLPTEVKESELNELKMQSMLASPLMDYKARGHQVELLGQEDVNGDKAWKIKLTAKEDGKITTYYIKASDYSLIKSETERDIMGQTANVESWYSNLKEFNGIKIFMIRVQKIEGQEFQTIKFDNVELNVTLDERIFDMPK
jgi:hypothetical protein